MLPPPGPRISVVIPTFNRAELLRASLDSLARQTLPVDAYEVVVVNDGSSDATEAVCTEFASRLRLRYFYIRNSGISAAKNLGIFAASAPLLLFFDDDDIATPTLLEEHLRAHRAHPAEHVAVLGYTAWAPSVTVTPVMEYVIDIGQQLFAYRSLKDGQRLDYTYFWGGRSSCKRSFLTRHGVFNQSFRSIIEDIELGFRLSRFNLQVVFHRPAVSHMVRPILYDDFCRRCERVGAALHLFDKLHADPSVRRYCQVGQAKASWDRIERDLGMAYYRVRELEAEIESQPDRAADPAVRTELHKLYKWTFDAFKMRGIVTAERAAAGASVESPVVEPVVVFQMGKVGSKSVETSLKRYDLGAPVCHSHFLNDLDRVERDARASRSRPVQTLAQIRHGRRLRKSLLGSPYVRCRVISLVRDPIARNIAAFFQCLDEFIPDYRVRAASGDLAVEELIGTFLERYDHTIPLTWFDSQLKPVFGIDVFAAPFPRERGYAVFHGPTAALLLVKLEKLKECAPTAVKEFLGIADFVLRDANVGEAKEYRDLYRGFLDSIRLEPTFVDRVYDSDVVHHFYAEHEIRAFRRRWRGRSLA
jgi:glycosyltransferase involved in cell wall biosynthesis